MLFYMIIFAFLVIAELCGAFQQSPCRRMHHHHTSLHSSSLRMSYSGTLEELNLPPRLEKFVTGLRNVPDDKLRYQQLLFLASKCKPMENSLKIDANKVPGCLSTVHVIAKSDDTGGINFLGDSDAQLTKGLVALLVEGLSGTSAEDIEKVRPEFIQYAGIANSLTPGRNNGFLNMLNMMKVKAKECASSSSSIGGTLDSVDDFITKDKANNSVDKEMLYDETPIESAMRQKLALLKPVSLEIINESSKHSGHPGMAGTDNTQESHFEVNIVADCFEGLKLVQRHRMIYTMLSKEMEPGGIHALSINAKTPAEAN